MAEISDLDITDANNNGSAANAGFPENMNYSDVNNAARALEGLLARWYADTDGTLDSGGSSNAYTLTPNRTISAYARGQTFVFEANHSNTGAATLNVSALGAKTIQMPDGTALVTGDIVSGGVYTVSYDGTVFQLLDGNSDKITASTSVASLSAMTAAPVGTDDILYIDGSTIKTMSYNESAKPVNTDSGTHTFADTDVGTIRVYTGTTATDAWTMNTGVGQDGCAIVVINDSASTDGPTLTAGTATIETSADGLLVKQNGMAVLVNIGSDVWKASGDLKS